MNVCGLRVCVCARARSCVCVCVCVLHVAGHLRQVKRYTSFLRDFEGAQQQVITSLSALNFGQNVIFSTAMTGMLVMSANAVAAGTMTIGVQSV